MTLTRPGSAKQVGTIRNPRTLEKLKAAGWAEVDVLVSVEDEEMAGVELVGEPISDEDAATVPAGEAVRLDGTVVEPGPDGIPVLTEADIAPEQTSKPLSQPATKSTRTRK